MMPALCDAEAATRDIGRIRACGDDLGDTGFDERIGARGLLAEVAAGLERDVGRGAAWVVAFGSSIGEGLALGVQVSESLVVADPDDTVLLDEYAPNERVGLDITERADGGTGGDVEIALWFSHSRCERMCGSCCG
ncbi:MAG: hypothetical protein KF705_14350 [Phycisphaeraceae bacterium]|nr:hypothetical protein [Phycisphaeraceae bacterium]